jgi:hypothetical protein
MRKVILFAIYLVMVGGGGFALAVQLAYASRIWFMGVAGSGAIMALGLYLLWTDIIGPALGAKVEE